jgi:YfiH family protein
VAFRPRGYNVGLFRFDPNSKIYLAQSLEAMPWIEHGFGTRLTSDWPDTTKVVAVRQIHSDRVIVAEDGAEDGAAGWLGESDAMVTRRPGLLLSIRTADCLPILIADPESRSVAAIHAGWRGTVADVAGNAVRTMIARYEAKPAAMRVAIGPGIGPCCFEVGPEVATQFKPLFPERTDLDGRVRLNLVAAIIVQLRQLGIPEGQIDASGLCTACGPEMFESYRRDREASGRMTAAIGIR